MTQNPYNNELKNRIFDLMDEAGFIELTGGYDWKAIYKNVISAAGDVDPEDITDELINEEIKAYYIN